MSGNTVHVSVVIPVYNEQATLPELIQRCIAVGRTLGCSSELIMVDDGSSDDSARIIRAAADRHGSDCAVHLVGVFLNRNYGQHAAIMAGFAEARGDVVVTLDADLQNPPEEIPRLLERIEAGCDIAAGVRTMRKDSRLRVAASRAMNAVTRKVSGSTASDHGCMLRAYRRTIVDAVLQCPERGVYVPALAGSFASRVAEVPVAHSERRAGTSKYGLWKLLNLYFDLFVSTTTAPLRILSVSGAAFAALGTTFGSVLLGLRLAYGSDWASDGVFTIFAVLFFFLGVQLIGMGLMGEYLARISRDVQGRPRYLVREVVRPPAANRESLPVSRPIALVPMKCDD